MFGRSKPKPKPQVHTLYRAPDLPAVLERAPDRDEAQRVMDAVCQRIHRQDQEIQRLTREVETFRGQKSTVTTYQPIPEPVAPLQTGWQPIPSHDGVRPLPMKGRGWLRQQGDWLLGGGRSSKPAVRSCPLTTGGGGSDDGYCPMAARTGDW